MSLRPSRRKSELVLKVRNHSSKSECVNRSDCNLHVSSICNVVYGNSNVSGNVSGRLVGSILLCHCAVIEAI